MSKSKKVKVEIDKLPTYPLSKLRSNCRYLYSIEVSTFDGVFNGYNSNEELTIAKAQEIINKWLEHGKDVS